MKKLLCVAIALFMIFALISCDTGLSDEPDNTTEGDNQSVTTASTTQGTTAGKPIWGDVGGDLEDEDGWTKDY